MNRKGFSVAQEDQSVEHIQCLYERGAKIFVAEKTSLAAKAGFEQELRYTFNVVAECNDAILFCLDKPTKTNETF
jgi:hypothetical protein